MLKKLLKQEWKSFFPAPTITMIILAVVTLIMMSTFMTSFWEQDSNIFVDLFASLTVLTYIICLAALSLCVTLCTVIRFYKNFFTDEGYLMFTLPVKTSDLILSKTLVAVIWRLISFLFIILSVFGIASVGVSYLSDTSIVQFFKEFTDMFGELFSEMQTSMSIPLPLLFFWLLLIGISTCVFDILFFYACICLGQLWSRHKIGGAVIAYFALRFIFRFFRQIFAIPFSDTLYYNYDLENISAGTWILGMFITLLIMCGLCVALYCICHFIMNRKLNLD